MPLSELRGQPRTLDLLRRFVASGQAPATIVFTGPEGAGRFLAARLLGEALICVKARSDAGGALFGGESAEPKDGGCGECAECKQVRAGTHPDFRVVRPPREWDPPLWPLPKGREESAEILIDQVREVAREAELKPFSAPCKIYVIDPVDGDVLRDAAANALLKLLEEPPTATYFFLVARSKAALLPTIASRAVAVPLAALPFADADAILAALAPDLAPAERALRLRLAGGRPAAAKDLDPEKARGEVRDALALLGSEGGGRLARAAAIPQAREAQTAWKAGFLLALRELARARAGRENALVFPEFAAEYRAALAATPEPEAALAFFTAFLADARLNLNPRLHVAARLAAPGPLDDPWLDAE